jgi:2-polyprenyl-6-methoxyphenol hydroxylase-like FAD-dependent oxidoreductase
MWRQGLRHTDIAIVGGGLAGSTAAAMLGRAGVDAILVDPHAAYPADFRCEKLDASQVALLIKTGLADAVLPAATPDNEIWVARFGRLVDQRPNHQYSLLYETLVNTVRAAIPRSVPVFDAKATAIATGEDRQIVTLSSGEQISARLVVLANGLNIGLRHTLGLTRDVISNCHSISIGFDMKPAGRRSFDFRALTYFTERAADRMAYITLFPIGMTMRANLFVYRTMDDPWLQDLRKTPQRALFALMPGLRNLTGDVEVTGFIKARPVDLYVTRGHRQAGFVLAGDAFSTSCPAAGTGVNKVLTDVERLCHVHIPKWLATPGMGADKIAAFYDDPVKQACERYSIDKAFYLRQISTETGAVWGARRFAKFLGHVGLGLGRRVRARLAAPASDGATTVTPELPSRLRTPHP